MCDALEHSCTLMRCDVMFDGMLWYDMVWCLLYVVIRYSSCVYFYGFYVMLCYIIFYDMMFVDCTVLAVLCMFVF